MEDERSTRALERAAEALERSAEALERAAVAQERLNDLATSERLSEPQPGELFDAPVCPHCGTFNPYTQTKGGEGPLSRFVLATPCGSCGKAFYAIPLGWRILPDQESARRLLDTSTDEG